MLAQLCVKNLAIVENIQIHFERGLNIITGQTGAGKSVLLSALHLLSGKKANTQLIRSGQKACRVEAVFELENPKLLAYLKRELDVELEDNLLMISREITADGKSRATVNGRLVNISYLRLLVEPLMDIHSQREAQSLFTPGRHLALIDEISKSDSLLEKVRQTFGIYKELIREKDELEELKEHKHERLGWLEHQLDEITQAHLKEGEEENLLREKNLSSHSEEIHDLSQDILQTFHEGESSVIHHLRDILKKLKILKDIDRSYEELFGNFESCFFQLEDIRGVFQSSFERMEFNPHRLGEVNERLYLYKSLQKKYQKNVEELLIWQADLTGQIDILKDHSGVQLELDQKIVRAEKALNHACSELRRIRKKNAKKFDQGVQKTLRILGMPHASLVSRFSPKDYSPNGVDDMEFMFTGNIGEQMKPLRDIVSGGEASRVLLAIKTLLADADHVPLSVFDEIDSNIGGEIAVCVGQKLKEVSRVRQVLCVTHLPQIACLGDAHFYVSKRVVQGRTIACMSKISGEDRVQEMARMLGGDRLTTVTKQHARELLKVSFS